jgi:IMP dehydrogenase|tara:strand:+ start:1972 stop:3405 length:1434 start_codon:yes stop_codon:yes gene_type:complete
MAERVILETGKTFSEFSLLTNYTPKECTLQKIHLNTKLGNLKLGLPFLSAAMTSVTGYDMALALGKEGGLGVLPARLSIDEQVSIIERIKGYEMGFVKDPITVRETATIDEVVRLVEKHGHSKVPIADRNNVFLGLFSFDKYLEANATPGDSVTTIMITPEELPCTRNPNISLEEAKEELKGHSYLVVLDELGRLVKIAFQKDIDNISVAAAISTHKGWKKRVKSCIKAGADMIVIDTSDAYNEFTSEVIKEFKELNDSIPICAGNVITYEGAKYLMENGADMIKVGMSSGSICTTQREKATGRAPMTALLETAKARDEHYSDTGKYVSIIVDGGVSAAGEMIIALTVADAVMMGGYFNHFYEAEGEKLDDSMQLTNHEPDIKYIATWGEGSARARNLDRYGHVARKTFFAEGEEGTVDNWGRLKPKLKQDIRKIKAALSNNGSMNLEQFRNKAVIELMSTYTQQIIGSTHNMQVKE